MSNVPTRKAPNPAAATAASARAAPGARRRARLDFGRDALVPPTLGGGRRDLSAAAVADAPRADRDLPLLAGVHLDERPKDRDRVRLLHGHRLAHLGDGADGGVRRLRRRAALAVLPAP